MSWGQHHFSENDMDSAKYSFKVKLAVTYLNHFQIPVFSTASSKVEGNEASKQFKDGGETHEPESRATTTNHPSLILNNNNASK